MGKGWGNVIMLWETKALTDYWEILFLHWIVCFVFLPCTSNIF